MCSRADETGVSHPPQIVSAPTSAMSTREMFNISPALLLQFVRNSEPLQGVNSGPRGIEIVELSTSSSENRTTIRGWPKNEVPAPENTSDDRLAIWRCTISVPYIPNFILKRRFPPS